MKAGDFAAWLSAILGMNEGQRTEAIAALEKASAVGAEGGGSAKRSGKRSRQKDALGTTGVERVAAQGCPYCAGGEVVGWGRSHVLLRFRCKSCGRTFNALTKTPMAHLRKKEKWLDHRARDDRGQKPGQDRGALRRPSDDAVPLATSVSARPRKRQAPRLKRDRRSGRNLRPRILQGSMVRSAAQSPQARRNGPTWGPSSGQHTRPRRPRPEGRDFRRGLASRSTALR
jgi:hypothetical protein